MYPFYLELTEKYRQSRYCVGTMKDYVDINPKTDCSSLTDEAKVSFVPMPNVQEKNNLVTYDLVPYTKVKKGFTVFSKGDLIWAKITPCMQNGKSCVTNNMPTEIGFGSTEFHVIRQANKQVYMPFIWAIFSNENVLKAAQATFSGSAGQQRVPASFLERFPAVIPEFNMQKALVNRIERELQRRNNNFALARELLSNFEQYVSDSFGLKKSDNCQLCFSIRLNQLDGVIDVKRYAELNSHSSMMQISDICNIVDAKYAASYWGKEVVDWIRIDDLPNQPMDIEKVRTQPASEIEGSFFLVEAGDILVARLGPTILNQKIVMVRKTERTTIASAEFLVLRCKKGYDAEAVMAVLKTEYYRDLMYSHARGSTPSRYRLNKEDMLKLPFPDIRERQEKIAAEATDIRNQVKSMRTQAEEDWKAAKEQFESELLGEMSV